ncbi:MAG: tetratricopeptide repeat protein [Catenisphaera adipataccumulans]|uniref:tetratricopeptide repeat protein n=1 Tax=Catenisphaera adipataccumulans TaxID=700500 RepID=UPI003D8FBC57
MNQEELRDTIIDALDQDEWEQALNLIEQYYREYGPDFFYFMSLSDCYMYEERFHDVLDLMHHAKELGFQNTYIHERTGDALIGMGRFEEALESYLQCDIDDDDAEMLRIRYIIGFCYMKLNDYQNAASYFEDVLLEADYPMAYLMCGTAYMMLDKDQLGIEYIDKAVALDSNLLDEAAETMNQMGSLEGLHSLLDHHLEADNADHLQYEYDFFMENDQYDEAIDRMEQLKNSAPNIWTYSLLGNAYAAKRESEKADRCYRAALDAENVDMDEKDVLTAKLILLENLGLNKSEQYQYLKEYLHSAKANLDIYSKLCEFATEHENKRLANQLMKIETDPETPESIAFHISYYMTFRMPEEGLEYMKTIDHSMPQYYAILLLFQYYAGHLDEVIALKEKALPDGHAAFYIYCSYLQTGRFEEAENFFKTYADSFDDPDDENWEIFSDLIHDLDQRFTDR